MKALTGNGTDEGVLRAWLDREVRHWRRALEASLQQEIDDLRRRYLGDRQRRANPGERALRNFSCALVELLSSSRSIGALTDNALRRLAEEAEPKSSLSGALAEAFARAGRAPAGDQALHESWARCLMLLFYQHATAGPAYPGPDAMERVRLGWARRALAGLDSSQSLQAALEEYLSDPGVRPVVAAVVEHRPSEVLRYQRGLPEARIGLITSAGARWLAGAVERT